MYAPKSESNTDFEKHPVGYATAVCTRLIDLGTHFNPRSQPPKDQRKIMIAFESEKVMTQEGEYKGQPFLLFANFNYSMYQGKAHLCTFIENWRGERFESQTEADNFDLATLIGKTAFCNVVRSACGKYANIQTIGPVPESMNAPNIVGKTILIDQDNLNSAEVDKLSDNLKAKVLSAKERSRPENNGPEQMSENPGAGMDDSIPF